MKQTCSSTSLGHYLGTNDELGKVRERERVCAHQK